MAAFPSINPASAVSRIGQELVQHYHQLAVRALADSTYDVPHASQELGLSERSFYRRFKKLTGETPAAYMRRLRLAEGRRLLETKEVTSVREAAERVGFDDVVYFARLFYKHHKVRANALLKP